MDENEVFENYHFVMIKRLRMVVCIWPYQNKTLKFYGRSFIIFAIYTMLIPLMIKIYEEWYEDDRDVQILTENFAAFLYFQMVLSKLCMSVYTEKKLQHLYETMTNDYKQLREPREKAAMDEVRDFARTLAIMYAFYMFTTLIFLIFKPQVVSAIFDVFLPLNESRHKMICCYAEYFVDQDEHLFILTLHTFVVVAITLIIVVAADTSYIAVTYHVIGLFSVLSCRLKRLCEWTDSNVNREDDRLHNFIIDTIKIHNKTLDFAELVRSSYDVCNFIVFGIALLTLPIGTIDVVMNLTNPQVILRIGFVFVGVVLNMFFVNLPGQRCLDSSDDLGESIYSCNWYKLPKKTQFLMKFMMMRCLIPCELTAGPLFQVNYAFCGSILRTALSYFMVAYSLS